MTITVELVKFLTKTIVLVKTLTRTVELELVKTLTETNNYNYNMYLQSQESTTIYDSQIDHVWTNAPTQQCIYGVLEAYWTNHKPIYFTFKLPNYVPQYCHVN